MIVKGHIDHIEDLLFTNELPVIKHYMIDLLHQLRYNTGKIIIQKKIDGSPSIIVGDDVSTGKRFVATKSWFNKSPKINFTHDDINNNHKGILADKLHQLLNHANELQFYADAIQGDFMFTPEDIKITNINNNVYACFNPNTITYAVPLNSKLYDQIKDKIGIVWHTSYYNEKVIYNIDNIPSTENIWCSVTTFNPIRLSSVKFNNLITLVNEKLNIQLTFKERRVILTYNSLLKQYINVNIRNGITYPSFCGFIRFITDHYQKKIDGVKTEKAKKRHHKIMFDVVMQFKDIELCLVKLFKLYFHILNIKEYIIDHLNLTPRFTTFLVNGKSVKYCADEGYVVIRNNVPVKFISRMEFSRNNFKKHGGNNVKRC